MASIVVGVLIALLFAQSRWVRKMLYPYTLLLQTVPIIAIAPLILMWVGAGMPAVTLIAFIISLAPIIANTTQGLISVDENLVHLFLMHNASPAQMLFKLRLPHAVPSLFVGIRIASGIAVIGAITGELYAGSSRVGEGGLGYSILYASSQLQTDYLFALVLAATVLGFSFFFLVMFLEWYFLHRWHESARAPETRVSRLASSRGGTTCCDWKPKPDGGWSRIPTTRAWPAPLPSAGATTHFSPPEPRAHVLRGIARHDDGWAARDAAPQITRQGKPSAFSMELVGKYSAFEEIDLVDYLAVRDRAVRSIAAEDPYAALADLHAYIQPARAITPTARPSRRSNCRCSTSFSSSRKRFSKRLLQSRSRRIRACRPSRNSEEAILDHFRLLQANDNLSLLTCVDFLRRRTCCIRCRCAVAEHIRESRCGRRARATSCSIPTRSTSLR